MRSTSYFSEFAGLGSGADGAAVIELAESGLSIPLEAGQDAGPAAAFIWGTPNKKLVQIATRAYRAKLKCFSLLGKVLRAAR